MVYITRSLQPKKEASIWCLTRDEARAWCNSVGVELGASEPRHQATNAFLSVPTSELRLSQLTWFSQFIASQLEPFDQCLFWVTLHGVWSSSENWHLYYRLRESYGERRQLHDAPAHVFLRYELADLATFIGLSLLNGWDAHLLPHPQYVSISVSHDEFVDIYPNDESGFASVKSGLESTKLRFTVRNRADAEGDGISAV